MRTVGKTSKLLVALALVTLPEGCTCEPGYASVGGDTTDTGAGSDDGTGDDGNDGGATSDDGGSGSTGGGTGTTSGGGTTSSSSGSATGTQSTGTTTVPCEPIPLANIALGVGGFAIEGESAYHRSGGAVAGAGDVNGDGLADVIVGVEMAAPTGEDSGRSYVVFGKASTASLRLVDVAQGIGGFVIDGEAEDDHSGHSVSDVGDISGDGLADVVVGAFLADPNGASGSGRSYAVFGKADTDPVSLAGVAQGTGGFAMDGEDAGDQAGRSVSEAGDVNGDGVPDIIVGAHSASWNVLDDAGRSYVVFGKADTDNISLASVMGGTGGFAIYGEADDDISGWSVSGAGDVNGDGLADVIVGAPGADPSGNHSGRAYVVFGKADTERVLLADVVGGMGGFALDGEAEDYGAGDVVSGAGDVNGDGLADVLVGSHRAEPNDHDSGRAYVVFGKTDTALVSLADVTQGIGGFAVEGAMENDWCGAAVSGAGDLNGDGLADVVVGSPENDPSLTRRGRAYVVFGKSDTAPVSNADLALGIGGFAMEGAQGDDGAGTSVSGAGDVNGDGVPDILVGAPLANPNGPNSGRTYVVFGGDFSCGGE